MTQIDPILKTVLDHVGQMAEPKLKAALKQHNVSSPDQLSRGVAEKIFRDIIVQIAVERFAHRPVQLKTRFLKEAYRRFFPLI